MEDHAVRRIDDLPTFERDLTDWLVRREELIAEAAAAHDVVRTPFGVTFFRRDEVQTLLRDRRAEARVTAVLELQGLGPGQQLYDQLATSLLNLNGPEHLRLRALVLKAFTPTAIERLRPAMHSLAEELVDGFAAAGRCEFMEDFANQYPVQVICTMLGVPREDRARFREWLDTVSFGLSMWAAQKRTEIEAAQVQLGAYIHAVVEDRKSSPGDDLVTALLAAREGDDTLTQDEVERMIGGLLFAGHDTTRNQLGRAMVQFSRHPDQWALLAERPDLAPRAVDEVTRLVPVVDTVSPRVVTEDVVVGGVAVPAGTVAQPSTYGADIDPGVYGPDARRFDISVERPVPPLTFGGGAHLCIGINLAKAEMAEAFAVLARRMRDLRPDGDPVFPPAVGIWGPTTVPLAFTPHD